MPRVSVPIPTHSRAHLLLEAVGSVLAQTYQDLEVIVIDDSSNDNTPEVAQGFPPYPHPEGRYLAVDMCQEPGPPRLKRRAIQALRSVRLSRNRDGQDA